MGDMTDKSLRESFAGESEARNKYTAFAEAAMDEDKENVARLFKAIAFAELVHAKKHLKALDEIGGTSENLQAAIDGENFEHAAMYPAYEAIAQLEEHQEALRAFKLAMGAEKVHEDLFSDAKQEVDQKDGDIAADSIEVCPVCGYAHIDKQVEKCPICGAPSERFLAF